MTNTWLSIKYISMLNVFLIKLYILNMKIKVFTLLLLYLFTFTQANNNTTTTEFPEVKPSIVLNSEDEYIKLLNTTDVTYLMFYYKKEHKESAQVAGYLKNVAAKLEYLAYILMVDCESTYGKTLSQCKDISSKPDDYPKLKLLKPPEYRLNPITQKMTSHEDVEWLYSRMSETTIYNFITTNIISRSSKINAENFDLFTG